MPEPSRTAASDQLIKLRDQAVAEAQPALAQGDWRAALACLERADWYELQALAIEEGRATTIHRNG